MADPWLKFGYEIVLTEDGSPSLRWLNSVTRETMHHRGGAYAETQLIYGNVVREVMKEQFLNPKIAVLSLGLGLGYNELLVAQEALQLGCLDKMFLQSFEADPVLSQAFVQWLRVGANEPHLQVYDEILKFFNTDRQAVAAVLLSWLDSGQWVLIGPLEENFAIEHSFDCILYDAFSSKTSPHLWQEAFLERFISATAGPYCQFSTYACTGPLKRALKKMQFSVVLREGFSGKRNSTLGIKKIQMQTT